MPDPVQRGRLAEVLRPLVGETYADYDILSVEFSDIACVENADGTFSPVVYLGNEVQQWPLDDEGGSAAYVEMAVRDIDGNSDNVSIDLTPADFSAFASILSVRSIDIATEEDTPAVFSDPIEATAEVRALPELTDTKLSTFEYNLTNPWVRSIIKGTMIVPSPSEKELEEYLKSLIEDEEKVSEFYGMRIDELTYLRLKESRDVFAAMSWSNLDNIGNRLGYSANFDIVNSAGDLLESRSVTPDIFKNLLKYRRLTNSSGEVYPFAGFLNWDESADELGTLGELTLSPL